MSDFDQDEFGEEEQPEEAQDEEQKPSAASKRYELKPGDLARFVTSMTPEQRAMWTPIRQAWKQEVKDAGRVEGEPVKRYGSESSRDTLYKAMNHAQGKITATEIENGIRAGLAKGDPQAVRVMAQMAGIDLSDRPQAAAGEGAKVIIIRPHPLLLNAAEEADIIRQIAEH